MNGHKNNHKKMFADDILPAMVLSPSAHNTQPWEFVVKGESSEIVDVFIDWQRHLRVSDPTQRELFISLGCVLTNATVAGHYHGYDVTIHLFPEGESHDAPVARITLAAERHEKNSDDTALYNAIAARRTDRSRYDGKPLTAHEKAAVMAGAPASVQYVDDRRLIENIARVSAHAMEMSLSRSDFKQELAHWVRNSWTSAPDGMPGYALGVPAPVSLLMPYLVRYAPIHKQEGPKTREDIQSASAVMVITSSQDSPREWLAVGQLVEMVWLRATAAGVAVALHAAAVEGSHETRQTLQTILGTQELPQAVLRIGHSSAHSLKAVPRRTIQDCLR